MMMRCKACNGVGEVRDGADDMWGNTISFWSECDWCEGTGETEGDIYKTKTYNLRITLEDGDVFEDGMDAFSREQALELAYWNWELATNVEVLS